MKKNLIFLFLILSFSFIGSLMPLSSFMESQQVSAEGLSSNKNQTTKNPTMITGTTTEKIIRTKIANFKIYRDPANSNLIVRYPHDWNLSKINSTGSFIP